MSEIKENTFLKPKNSLNFDNWFHIGPQLIPKLQGHNAG